MDAILLAQNVVREPVLFGGGFFLVWIILAVVGLVLWIWALIDAIQNPSLSSTERLIWILVIVFTNWIGAVLYLVIGRQRTLSPPANRAF